MQKSVESIIKGSHYYEAERLYAVKMVKQGVKVSLSHQPFNIHDKNAVAITLKNTGEMLGHLPREVAANYVESIRSGLVTDASISRIERQGRSLKFYVMVSWFVAAKPIIQKSLTEKNKKKFNLEPRPKSLKVKDLSTFEEIKVIDLVELENVAGVYAIRCEKNGRLYIGSSIGIKKRLGQHFSSLSKKKHHNSGLQADYLKYGITSFTYFLVRDNIDESALAASERLAILEYRNSGISLYNLTDDGQGKIPPSRNTSYTEISFPILKGADTLTPITSHKTSVSNKIAASKNSYVITIYTVISITALIIVIVLTTNSKRTKESIKAKNEPHNEQVITSASLGSLEDQNYRTAISLLGGGWKGFIAHCLRWTKEQPNSHLAWSLLGKAYYKTEQYPLAINAYLQVVRIEPKDADSWFYLGNIYFELKNPQQSLDAYTQVMRINPKYPSIIEHLAKASYYSDLPPR